MRTAETGPSIGAPLTRRATEEAMIAVVAGLTSPSAERTLAMIWTSLIVPFGNIGRSGRSIKREINVASSDGRPSRLTKRLPLILPLAK